MQEIQSRKKLTTVKLKSDEYFTLENVEPKAYFMVGARGSGKSYSAKHYVKDMLLESGFMKKYLYVRINKNEIPTHDGWLRETGIHNELPFETTSVSITRGKPRAGEVSLSYDSPLGSDIIPIGYVASLESSALIKSDFYDDVGCIVFEEFLRRGMTQKAIEEYCFNFMELVETVRRDRKIPIFFIANSLNSYNPLLETFKEYEIIKIFSEPRRTDISEGKFSKYLQGEQYGNYDFVLTDFEYLTTIKINDTFLSLHVDRFFYKDILITNAKKTNTERPDLLNVLQRSLLYNFSTLEFMFDSEKTEMFFYTNIDDIKLRLRNRLTAVLGL